MGIRSAFVLFSMLLVSCSSSPTEALEGLDVATDRSTYPLGEAIEVEIRNDTEADAFFAHCAHRFHHVIQKRSGGGWSDHGGWGPWCPAIYASGVEVLIPGAAKRMSTSINERGTYRMVLETGPRSAAIGAVTVTSNVFEVD